MKKCIIGHMKYIIRCSTIRKFLIIIIFVLLFNNSSCSNINKAFMPSKQREMYENLERVEKQKIYLNDLNNFDKYNFIDNISDGKQTYNMYGYKFINASQFSVFSMSKLKIKEVLSNNICIEANLKLEYCGYDDGWTNAAKCKIIAKWKDKDNNIRSSTCNAHSIDNIKEMYVGDSTDVRWVLQVPYEPLENPNINIYFSVVVSD